MQATNTLVAVLWALWAVYGSMRSLWMECECTSETLVVVDDLKVFGFVNLQVRVFAPEDQISQASYALEVAVKVLDYYNSFFGIPYPLPKQGTQDVCTTATV